MTSIILDVDTGIDDTLAILTAALSNEIDLVACTTTWGNIDLQQAARNTAFVLWLADRDDVPVALGAAEPYDGREPWYSEHVHGADGQGGRAHLHFEPRFADASAVDTIIAASHAVQDLELVAVGPLTNLAHALDADPTLPRRIRQVTIMGGAALAPGNVHATAEANIHHDPEAADRVFAATWPITMVGLDVTMRAIITEDHRARLAAGGPAAQHTAAILDHYFDFYAPRLGYRGAANHDALALAVGTGLVRATVSPTVHVEVDTSDGPERGRTVTALAGEPGAWIDDPNAPHRVVLETEPGFEDRMIDLIAPH